MTHRRIKLSTLALSIGLSCSAFAGYSPQFSTIHSFGDSLSDMGALKTPIQVGDKEIKLSNIFTTPGGKTAAGHLANSIGTESTAALKLKVDGTAVTNLAITLLQMQTPQQIKGLLESPGLKETINPDTVKKLGELVSHMEQLEKPTNSTQEKAAADNLVAEAQRIMLTDMIAKLKAIEYETTKNGNNWAVGGASATSVANGSTMPVNENVDGLGQIKGNFPLVQPSLKNQVDRYLKRDGQADPNALYTITVGANDLFRAANLKKIISASAAGQGKVAAARMKELLAKNDKIPEAKKAELIFNASNLAIEKYLRENRQKPESIIADAAQNAAKQAQRLIAAGAKYVVLTNLPDVNDTPDYANKSAAEKYAARKAVQGFNQMLQASLSKTPVIYADINGFLKTVKADPSRFGFSASQPSATFCSGNSADCQANLTELVTAGAAIDSITLKVNEETANKKQLEAAALLAKQGVELDDNNRIKGTLTAEQAAIIDKAGIPTEVKLNEKQTAETKAKLIAAAKKYIFADGVHPSSAVHKYLADVLMEGYLKAPGYNANMQSLARSGQTELSQLFESRRSELAAQPLAEGELRPYVNISGTRGDGDKHPNLAEVKVESVRLYAAMDYGITDNTGAGALLTVQRDKQNFTNGMNGKQERQALVAGGYLSHQFSENWSVGASGYAGKGQYNQVRNFNLGDGKHTSTVVNARNTSKTDSLILGASVGANGLYTLSELDIAPRANISYQYEKLKGYTEDTDTAGNVKFDDVSMKRTDLSLGLNVSKTFLIKGMSLKPFADIDWRHQISGDKIQTVRWQTAAATTDYIPEDMAKINQSFAQVKFGGQLEITQGLTTQLVYSRKVSSSLGPDNRFMLDLGYRF